MVKANANAKALKNTARLSPAALFGVDASAVVRVSDADARLDLQRQLAMYVEFERRTNQLSNKWALLSNRNVPRRVQVSVSVLLTHPRARALSLSLSLSPLTSLVRIVV